MVNHQPLYILHSYWVEGIHRLSRLHFRECPRLGTRVHDIRLPPKQENEHEALIVYEH